MCLWHICFSLFVLTPEFVGIIFLALYLSVSNDLLLCNHLVGIRGAYTLLFAGNCSEESDPERLVIQRKALTRVLHRQTKQESDALTHILTEGFNRT